MAASAGVFTPSDNHAELILAAEQIFGDARLYKQFDKPIGTLNAISQNSTVRIENNSPLRDAFTNRTVKVWWPETCSMTAVDPGSSAAACAISGSETGTDSTTYDKNFSRYIDINVKVDRRNNLLETAREIQYNIELAKATLEEAMNTSMISTLDANFSANDFGDDASGSYAANIVTYDSAAWNADLIAEIDLMAKVNQIMNPIVVHGQNLYKDVFLAELKRCCDNEGDRNLFNYFNHYWDVRAIDSQLSEKASFVVEPGSIAVWNAYLYDNEVPINTMDSKNTHVYSETSNRLSFNGSPVRFDIVWQRDCIMLDDEIRSEQHQIRVWLRGGIAISPNNCSNGTGILKLLNSNA